MISVVRQRVGQCVGHLPYELPKLLSVSYKWGVRQDAARSARLKAIVAARELGKREALAGPPKGLAQQTLLRRRVLIE